MGLDTTRTAVQTIGGYELLEKIAEGGMGAVYKARDPQSGSIVAVKVVPPHMTANPVMMKRFEQEYNAASTLDHPNIVRALAFGYHNGAPYLVMEYVQGESLGQRLDREGRIPESEAVRLIGQVAQGLHRAHKEGMIHRDVKPDNILVTADGQAKLADLGLVKELETDLNLTRTGRGLGTPHFMAPEQFRNAKNADARCDIYSMAATLYMMVTGELPFKSLGPLDAWMKKIDNKLTPARQLEPSLSERVDWAIQRAMSADPTQRPSSCREFVEDLTGHSTRKLTPPEGEGPQDMWYLMYTDDEGVLHTVKGSMAGVRRSLKDGVLGDASNVRACRTKSGPFESLRNHPEFRDLVITPSLMATKTVARPPAVTTQPPSTPSTEPRTKSGPVPVPPLEKTQPPPEAPHIDLGAGGGQGEWDKWLLLFLVAIVTAFGAYYLLPLLP